MDEDWFNSNDIVYSVAKRAKELTEETMDELRLRLSSDLEGRVGSARSEFLGNTKGDLIEMNLIEEFTKEYPKEFNDED